MGFRFFRRVRLFPGVSVNFSKSGPSLSVGPRGAKMTFGSRGVTSTVGLPGTGLYYTSRSPLNSTSTPRSTSSAPILPPRTTEPPPLPPTVEERLTLGYFQKLTTPDDEEDLVAGIKAMVKEDYSAALDCFKRCIHLADAAFLAGVVSMKLADAEKAAEYLEIAHGNQEELGKYFKKYGLTGSFSMAVTPELEVKGNVSIRLLLLFLVEACQSSGKYQDAFDALNELYTLDPADLYVRVSRSELLINFVATREAFKQGVELAKDIGPDSEVEAVLLLYKAEALRKLGLLVAALDTINELLRHKSIWSEKLVRAMRFERGLIYDASGDSKKARADWETVYAEDPKFEDVAKRLGL